MPETLFVVIGAGASYDAASSWQPGEIQPPLVKELFHPTHQDVLADYPLAQSAAPEIRDALKIGNNGEAVSLEHHLRNTYRDSDDPYDRRRFYSISLYLQDLLWKASEQAVHFNNIDRLVAVLLRKFDHVCFITLNYDTILDQALAKLDPLSDLDGYIAQKRWSLIKLHGSVDWGYRPEDDVSVDNPPPDLRDHLSSTILRARHPSYVVPVNTGNPPRYAGSTLNETKLFPALTVPVGEEDEIVCPERHQRFLSHLLNAQDELNLLVLGYSAYDRTVIQRLGDSEKRIRNLMIVNADQVAAMGVFHRLQELLPRSLNGTSVEVAQQPFGQWCREGLQPYAASIPSV